MDQYSRVLSEIQRKIQDDSYGESELQGFMNDGLRELATEVVLPGLLTNSVVTCSPGSFSVSMPSDYFAGLLWARNFVKNRWVYIYDSLTAFLERYDVGMTGLSQTGEVHSACRHGHMLYFAHQPATGDAQDLRLWYSAAPTLLKTGDEDISYIPEHLQARLLINYVCMEVFSEIEEERNQPQVEKYYTRFSGAKAALIEFVGLPERRPSVIPNTNDPWTLTDTIQQGYSGDW